MHLPRCPCQAVNILPRIRSFTTETERQGPRPIVTMAPKKGSLEVWGNETTMNLNEILYGNILSSRYFKQDLLYVYPFSVPYFPPPSTTQSLFLSLFAFSRSQSHRASAIVFRKLHKNWSWASWGFDINWFCLCVHARANTNIYAFDLYIMTCLGLRSCIGRTSIS